MKALLIEVFLMGCCCGALVVLFIWAYVLLSHVEKTLERIRAILHPLQQADGKEQS